MKETAMEQLRRESEHLQLQLDENIVALQTISKREADLKADQEQVEREKDSAQRHANELAQEKKSLAQQLVDANSLLEAERKERAQQLREAN